MKNLIIILIAMISMVNANISIAQKLEKYRMASANPGMIYINGVDQKLKKGQFLFFNLKGQSKYMLEIKDTNMIKVIGTESVSVRKDGSNYWYTTQQKMTIKLKIVKKGWAVANLYLVKKIN